AKPPRKTSRSSAPAEGKKPKTRAPASRAGSSHGEAQKPLKSPPPGLAEGSRAPSFRLPRDGGTQVSLSDFAGQKLVIFFTRAPIRPAAPGRPSTSPGSRR